MTDPRELHPPTLAIDGEVALPGSKSDTHRALLLAAHASGSSALRGVSESRDTELLIRALTQLGLSIERDGEECVVRGTGGEWSLFRGELDLELAGTSLRFLVPLCASLPLGSEIVITGSPRMCERPVGDLVDALRVAGARVEYLGTEGCPPLRVHGAGRLRGGTVAVSGEVSSQFISALLLNASRFDAPIELRIGDRVPSRSYVEWTLRRLESFAVDAAEQPTGYTVSNVEPTATNVTIDGDGSGASAFWALAAVSGGRVRVTNIRPGSQQPDLAFVEALVDMGCRAERGPVRDALIGETHGDEDWIEVVGPGTLRAIDVDLSALPDTAMTLAVVAAFASGTTHLRGLESLPFKECDRLAATVSELQRCGIDAQCDDASLTIVGGEPQSATFRTYGDHRMAMAFAVMGARMRVSIENPDVVAKSFPSFWSRLTSLGIESHVR